MEVPGAEAVVRQAVTVAAGNWLYQRLYVYLQGNPTTASGVIVCQARTAAGAAQYACNIGSARTPTLRYAGTLIGSAGAALATGTWHLIELGSMIQVGALLGSAELRVNGTTVATETAVAHSTAAQGRVYAGGQNNPPTTTSYYDAYACNDSTGSAPDNTWVGALAVASDQEAMLV